MADGVQGSTPFPGTKKGTPRGVPFRRAKRLGPGVGLGVRPSRDRAGFLHEEARGRRDPLRGHIGCPTLGAFSSAHPLLSTDVPEGDRRTHGRTRRQRRVGEQEIGGIGVGHRGQVAAAREGAHQRRIGRHFAGDRDLRRHRARGRALDEEEFARVHDLRDHIGRPTLGAFRPPHPLLLA